MTKEKDKQLDDLLGKVELTPTSSNQGSDSQNIRTFAQGLTFGFADEIEAFVRSAVNSNASYADTLKEVRNKINKFRQDNPVAAYGTEIAGAILPSVAAAFIPGGQAVSSINSRSSRSSSKSTRARQKRSNSSKIFSCRGRW